MEEDGGGGEGREEEKRAVGADHTLPRRGAGGEGGREETRCRAARDAPNHFFTALPPPSDQLPISKVLNREFHFAFEGERFGYDQTVQAQSQDLLQNPFPGPLYKADQKVYV